MSTVTISVASDDPELTEAIKNLISSKMFSLNLNIVTPVINQTQHISSTLVSKKNQENPITVEII